ncbi:MAG: hypothetical protein LUF87_10525 [Alistipes sp.]|nr:hypothetical protein [Alistipes sp.]
MKNRWANFWNFFIQFFVVVLGVFITLFIGNITERSKENRKTRQALQMISAELQEYREILEERLVEIETDTDMYRRIVSYLTGQQPRPSIDTIVMYVDNFRGFHQRNLLPVSLKSAEMSGAINNIKDLSLVGDIYDSYEYISLVYKFQNEMQRFGYEKKRDNITPDNLNLLMGGNDPVIERKIALDIWNEWTTNPELFSTIVNGNTHSSLSRSAVFAGIESIDKAVEKIGRYK